MQPNRNPTDWQQPPAQPTQTPHVEPQVPEEVSVPATPTPEVSEPAEPLPPQEEVVISSPPEAPAAVQEADAPVPPAQEPVHWQAYEYVHHDKNVLWFVVFGLVVVALMAIAIFLLQSITFAILIPVMAVALVMYSHRPPRLLDYTLSHQGLHVNDHLYSFAEFKGFGVIHDGSEYSIMLLPRKRFKPGVSVYFPEEAGEAIVDMLGGRLPMQELHIDIVDKLIHKLRI